ncbi:hypothetical protein NQ317_007150 [Molorchus minor]|uniref:Tyrosine--tRNA ligase n=1 Tax=Molorchus minor TaxID=1323400 RepID=A0ABQ9J4Y0_9CUCU|nr:hypothetical protein NQ317_007150 [Molorchus minor]
MCKVLINLLECYPKLLFIRRSYSNRNILKLKDRGMFQDIFPDNAANSVIDMVNASPQTVYGGFDPTADSLHIGNLLVLEILAGRNTERDELSKVFIDDNIQGIYKNINTVFSNHVRYIWKDKDKLKSPIIINNDDWYKNISAVELIGGIGRHLRMGTLLSRTSVQSRLHSAAGMSLTGV